MNNLFAQKSKADSLFKNGNLKESLLEFKKVYQQSENEKIAYKIAEIHSLLNEKDSAFYFLGIGTKSDSTYKPVTNKFFIHITDDKRWDDFTHIQLEKYQAKKGYFKDYEYAKELLRLRQLDQAYYYEIYLSEFLNGSKSPITKALWHFKESINKDLMIELKRLVDEKGYPKCSEKMPCSSAFLIIQHAELESQEYFLPIIKNLCESKDISCNHYAMLIDRIKLRKNELQIYGTQMQKDKDGKWKIMNLVEPNKVNERRKEIGINLLENF